MLNYYIHTHTQVELYFHAKMNAQPTPKERGFQLLIYLIYSYVCILYNMYIYVYFMAPQKQLTMKNNMLL